jgi:hypothetical protein
MKWHQNPTVLLQLLSLGLFTLGAAQLWGAPGVEMAIGMWLAITIGAR